MNINDAMAECLKKINRGEWIDKGHYRKILTKNDYEKLITAVKSVVIKNIEWGDEDE